MPTVAHALIHRARVIRTLRAGERNSQGERPSAPVTGPWFPARRTGRRPPNEGAADPGGHRRAEKGWLLIFGDEYEDGAPLVFEEGTALGPPQASDTVEVEVPEGIVRYEVTGRASDYDDGYGAFGGQVELVEVGASS